MRLNEIVTQKDYNDKLYEYKMSPADKEKKEKAIRELKIAFPEFDISAKTTDGKVFEMIKEGTADIDDIN